MHYTQEELEHKAHNFELTPCDATVLCLDYKPSPACTKITSNRRRMAAMHYTQEELEHKAHNFELTPCDATVLCLDYKMSGVGSNSCSLKLAEPYQLCETQFIWELDLRLGR